MARYGYDERVRGREMRQVPRRSPMGMDPNYRGGYYGGERPRGRDSGDPYGRYRIEHGHELAEHGGARGRATGAGMLRDPGPTPRSGPAGPPRPRSPRAARRPPPYDTPYHARDRGRYRDPVYPDGRAERPPRNRSVRSPRSEPRDPRFGASRPLRYDHGFADRARQRGSFSEGYLGSGF